MDAANANVFMARPMEWFGARAHYAGMLVTVSTCFSVGGAFASAAWTASPVPEPGHYAMLVAGPGLLVFTRRKSATQVWIAEAAPRSRLV